MISVISKLVSGLSMQVWYEKIFFAGVRPIALKMLSHSDIYDGPKLRLFEFWWCFCIKFFTPWALYMMIIRTLAMDIEERYDGLHTGW